MRYYDLIRTLLHIIPYKHILNYFKFTGLFRKSHCLEDAITIYWLYHKIYFIQCNWFNIRLKTIDNFYVNLTVLNFCKLQKNQGAWIQKYQISWDMEEVQELALLKAQICMISFQTCTQMFGIHKALLHAKR